MRKLIVPAVVLISWSLSIAESVATIAEKASQAYDRIKTFSADAWVYEYYG